MKRLWHAAQSGLSSCIYRARSRWLTSPAHFRVNHTRDSWENAFLTLWEPLLRRFSRGKASVFIEGPIVGPSGTRSDGYEGFARSFIGAAYYLHHREKTLATLPSGVTIDIADIYRQGIVAGVDPNHKEYWGRIRSRQRLVENCSVAIGLLLTKKHIWASLGPRERDNVARWFAADAEGAFYQNNWLWFKVFHYVFLEKIGYPFAVDHLEQTLETIERMYIGKGWYLDGLPPEGLCDYYVAWSVYYYALLFCYLADDKHSHWKRRFLERATIFFRDYEYFFSRSGHPPLYGRSQTYRWASVAPWPLALLFGCWEGSMDRVKRLMVSTVNSFLEKGAVGRDGILTLGYHGEFIRMVESYSSPASPYWAFKAFSILLLPEGHVFWAQPQGHGRSLRGVRTLATVGIVLAHGKNSHVVLHPSPTPTTYGLKYDKFAYSNIFLMNFDYSMPVDNAILLRRGLGRWRSLAQVVQRNCGDGFIEVVWKPEQLADVVIRSAVMVRPDGYLVLHSFHGCAPASFAAGGFPLPSSKRVVRTLFNGNAIRIQSEQGTTSMNLLHGVATPRIHVRAGVNPGGRYSFVPSYRGLFRANEDFAIFAVWAGGDGEPMGLPEVEVEETSCTVRWPERTYIVPLRGWLSKFEGSCWTTGC